MAHRGYAAAYPENTLESLKAAVDAGARFIEFDVQLTADAVPVLLHDNSFARTGQRSERVYDLSFADSREIAVGEAARLGGRFCDVRAPSLLEVVQWLQQQPQVTAFVELKRHSLEKFGQARVLDAVLPLLVPLAGRCVIISFVADVLREARERGNVPVGWALPAWNSSSQRLAANLAPEYLFCNVRRLPAEPALLWSGPWTWVVYEIVDPAEALSLLRRGVGMIETMQFTPMLQALAGGAPP